MFTLIKNIKRYFSYKNTLNQHKDELFKKFKVRVDKIGRLYTIFSIDPKDYESYGEELFNQELSKYKSSLDNYLIKIGLVEQYGLAAQERIDELNYKIVIRYKFIDTLFIANILMLLALATVTGIFIGLSIFLAL